MAKDNTSTYRKKGGCKRLGRHSKCNSSFNKNSYFYRKRYRGQGK